MASILEIVTPLAQAAARRLMELRITTLTKTRKADFSLVTNADHEADRIIREGLLKNFPDHAVITEESGLEGNSRARYVWLVDPLDGTKAYAKGSPGFSVMIGLLKEGHPCLGVVVDPLEGHVYEAVRGEGSFHTCKGKRVQVHVSQHADWNVMPIITSTGFPETVMKAIQPKIPCPWLPSINSVGIKVGLLVRHVADLYINHHSVHYWDTCAPQVILEEAGGQFTMLNGQPLVYDLNKTYQHTGPTLASNNTRHADFVRSISGCFPSSGPTK